MREILFRGKRTENEKWIEGFYYKDDTTGMVFIITWEDGKDRGCLTIEEIREVTQDTVGQFTGLTDKNGKKIFEGDIIRAKLESGNHEGFAWPNMPVDFQQGSFCLNDRKGYVFAVLGAFAPSVTFEVIGNIHDNPELLEVENAETI